MVLYFYPKDNTPGCTTFQRAGCPVAGISRDSLKSHESFQAKLEVPFELLSDPDEAKDKLMYGRKVRGIECSTFVLDEEGRLLRAWRGSESAGPRPGGIELC